MEKNAVLALVQKLNSHFGTAVYVRFAGQGARAHLATGEITYGQDPHSWFPNGAPTVIHEFAHHLDWIRKTYDQRRPHGEGFFRALIATIEASEIYSKEQHPWSREYNSVFHAAYRAGLTKDTLWDQHNPAAKSSWREMRKEVRKDRSSLRFHGYCDNCGQSTFTLGKFPTQARFHKVCYDPKKLRYITWTDTKTGQKGHLWQGRPARKVGSVIITDTRYPVLRTYV